VYIYRRGSAAVAPATGFEAPHSLYIIIVIGLCWRSRTLPHRFGNAYPTPTVRVCAETGRLLATPSRNLVCTASKASFNSSGKNQTGRMQEVLVRPPRKGLFLFVYERKKQTNYCYYYCCCCCCCCCCCYYYYYYYYYYNIY
jgi:hypothetical protein